MAASLHKSKHPTLLSRLEGHTDTVNFTLVIPGEDAIISASDDKWVDKHTRSSSAAGRVWRQAGLYLILKAGMI